MRLIDSLRYRISTLFHRSQANAEMEDELSSHIESRADDLERSGLSRAEAERQARIEFGGYQKFKEECREAAGVYFLETVLQDLRFAGRCCASLPALPSWPSRRWLWESARMRSFSEF